MSSKNDGARDGAVDLAYARRISHAPKWLLCWSRWTLVTEFIVAAMNGLRLVDRDVVYSLLALDARGILEIVLLALCVNAGLVVVVLLGAWIAWRNDLVGMPQRALAHVLCHLILGVFALLAMFHLAGLYASYIDA